MDREPTIQELDLWIDSQVGYERHFSAKELLQLRRAGKTAPVPPKAMWWNILPTLEVIEQIRTMLGHGLIVGNGYRPEPLNSSVGGAKNSQHIHFRALDVDLPNKLKHNREAQEALYHAAVEVWMSDKAKRLEAGLGLYRQHRGSRIHIDTGYKYRCWKRAYVDEIAEELR